MKENKHLKWLLIMQSFLPLYFLVIIRCFSVRRGKIILRFFLELFSGNIKVVKSALIHPEIFATILLCFSVVMLVSGLFVYLYFKRNQSSGYQEEKKKIIIDSERTEKSVAFFV